MPKVICLKLLFYYCSPLFWLLPPFFPFFSAFSGLLYSGLIILSSINMRRDLRPKSARDLSQNRNIVPLSSPFFQPSSAESPPLVPNIKATPESTPELEKPYQLSTSKFLKRFENIKASRSARNSIGNDSTYQEDIFVQPKKKSQTFSRNLRKVSENQIEVFPQYPEMDVVNQKLQRVRRTDRSPYRKSSYSSVELPKISTQELLFERGGMKESEEGRAKTAYWKSSNKFVTMFPLAKIDNLNYKHDHILPAYAQLHVQGIQYVVSDEYQNCSLENLIDQFGPFPEALAKRYLKQIALGVHHLHFNKKSHNKLNAQTILYNKHGNLFINMLASSSRPADDVSATKSLHWYSPESLTPKGSRSLKNDIWALGCLAICMLTNEELTSSALHPYNCEKFRDPKEATMIENLRQRYKGYFDEPYNKNSRKKEGAKLSEEALNFIASCMSILEDKRVDSSVLLEHEFFEGV